MSVAAKPVVLIAEELSPATVAALGPDFEIQYCRGADRAELLAALPAADAILVRSATKVDEEAISVAKNLKVIARAGVGLDNVDVKAATQAGVMVVNAPTSNITSAAELTVALILASARNVVPANLALRNGEWARSKYTGVELADKTVGIVGLGRIGMLVAQRLAGFDVNLVAYDPFVQPARAAQHNITMLSLDDVLEQSDFITVHLPKTPETIGLIGEDALKRVKPSVHIINVARGGIVDEAALAKALEEGRVGGAGLDVFNQEPCTDSPLFGFNNVVATPHLGASTDEAQEKAGVAVAKSVRLALAGEIVPDAVNVQGGVIDEAVRPRMPLAEHLGSIAAQLTTGPIASVEVEIRGELAQYDVNVLELSALKGLFNGLVHDPVSYVNAPLLAKERGVETSMRTEQESRDHRSLVTVNVAQTDGEMVSVSGTLTGPRRKEKLVAVNGFSVDMPLAEHLVVLEYADRPGVVGMAGRIFGSADINIANMQVSRHDEKAAALCILTLDSEVPAEVLAEAEQEIQATRAHAVEVELS